MTGTEEMPGLDLVRLGRYLDGMVPGLLAGPLKGELLLGGKSNLTYRITDGVASWVVRRPPLGVLLSTAHDVSREFRVMSCLAGSAVPVPKTLVLCEELDVLGVPFFVMEWVEGECYRTRAHLESVGFRRAASISTSMVETLGALHRVDPRKVHLERLGRPNGFVDRQVERWKKQLDSSKTREVPGADELFKMLKDRIPQESESAVLHGDFRLDNLLVTPDDRVAAVIDWEMATLGDPIADVAMLAVYGRLAESGSSAVPDQSTAAGYLDESQMLDVYEKVTGIALGDFGFYLGLASFKLAAILEGINSRFLRGETVGEGFESAGSAVEILIEAGLAALRER